MADLLMPSRPTLTPMTEARSYDVMQEGAPGCDCKLRCDKLIHARGETTTYTAYIQHRSWADPVQHSSYEIDEVVSVALAKYRTKTVAISRGWR